MIALEQARKHLETLGLKQAVEALDNSLDTAASKQLPYPEMLAELLGVEVAARRERYLTTRPRLAHLPFQRTLEQFDLGFQPSVDGRLVKELANLAFVNEATNILLLGPLGVGKTHLAVALALKVIGQGFGAYFVRAYDLMEDLRKARIEHNLDRRMRVYLSPKVLVVDEFGIRPYDRESATAFFTLVSARYERGSIIMTSNKGFGEWGELLGDTVTASAVLDHSHVLNIRGESYRLRENRQAGLFPSQQLLSSTSEETGGNYTECRQFHMSAGSLSAWVSLNDPRSTGFLMDSGGFFLTLCPPSGPLFQQALVNALDRYLANPEGRRLTNQSSAMRIRPTVTKVRPRYVCTLEVFNP